MPTTKYRINLTVPADLQIVLKKLAKRDEASVSHKTLELVRAAIDLNEDVALLKKAEDRSNVKGKFVSHEKAWL